MIMLGACIPPWLIQYADMIGEYNAMYGGGAWPLLYQCHTRFLREHMPRMLRMASRKLNKMIERGNDGPLVNDEEVEFLPKNPWNYLFSLDESKWWYRNFEMSANFVTNKVARFDKLCGWRCTCGDLDG